MVFILNNAFCKHYNMFCIYIGPKPIHYPKLKETQLFSIQKILCGLTMEMFQNKVMEVIYTNVCQILKIISIS